MSASLVDPATGDGHGDIQWNFALDNSQLQFLAVGQILTLDYHINVTDTFGATATQDVLITISGSNDAPIVTADTNAGDAVVESGVAVGGNTPFAGDPSATGNVLANDSDPDTIDVLTVAGVAAGTASGPLSGNVGTSVSGTYGTLTLGSNGQWTYALDNSNPNTNALAQGESATDVFSYTASDGHGGIAPTTTLSIAIAGTNDAPVITGDDVGRSVRGSMTAGQSERHRPARSPCRSRSRAQTQTWTCRRQRRAAAPTDHFRHWTASRSPKRRRRHHCRRCRTSFSDGNPPPSSPPLNPGQPNQQNHHLQRHTARSASANGKLLLDGGGGQAFDGAGTPVPSSGENVRARTNIDPVEQTHAGLKLQFHVQRHRRVRSGSAGQHRARPMAFGCPIASSATTAAAGPARRRYRRACGS